MNNAKKQGNLAVRLFTNLAFWVVIGIVGGVIVGMVAPELGIASKPGIDYFIKALPFFYKLNKTTGITPCIVINSVQIK